MPKVNAPRMTVAGLFAGIGGIELGFQESGIDSSVLIENWPPAKAVLQSKLDALIYDDISLVKSLPSADVVTAGFPCTDLSQAGRMAGIRGEQSSLVSHVFRLLPSANPTWLVLENVRNMLSLDGGRAMRYLVDELESRGYRWAYRLVDSRATGVPQRRQRVLLVASMTENPAEVLLTEDAGEPDPKTCYRDDAFGFYWTEGLTGLGWAQDAVPTFKGGSSVGIPSAPAVWIRDGQPGRAVVTPTIEDAEALQGFPRGWTEAGHGSRSRNGPRWKLVGNAVTVGVSRWLGQRLIAPSPFDSSIGRKHRRGDRWPRAAWGDGGQLWAADVSMWPVREPYKHLLDVLSVEQAVPLSARAAGGFLSRTERSRLRFDPEFLVAVKDHIRSLSFAA